MTAKLVKARPKAVEYLPEWARCCPAQKDKYEAQKHTVFTVNMSTSRLAKSSCHDCGKDTGKLIFMDAVSPLPGPVAIELFDLDEGAAL